MISTIDKIRTLRRELALRERAYSKWVSEGRMKAETADREIAIMRAILRDYEPRPADPDTMPADLDPQFLTGRQ
jgi:trimethylamine:corrinoid methyltransferase-like protein